MIRDIEAKALVRELQRRGIAPDERITVLVERGENDDLPISAINQAGGGFDWLDEEPDLYSDEDLVERYRSP
jgi:hypothetical protein